MPEILVISDIHTSTRWRKITAQRKPGDEIIFLGDYFDHRGAGPFASSQVDNFLEICAYAEANPPTTMLMGNHDYNYTPWALSDMSWEPDAWEISKALMAKIRMMEMVAVRRNLAKPMIFSHGGVTQTFMRNHSLDKPEGINRLWLEQPDLFEWLPRDPATGERSNRYGDDPWQSPIWVRDNALYEDGARGFDQVVGHTPVREITSFATQYGDTILMTCTLKDEPAVIKAL